MAIKTVATNPSNTMIAIFHFFALVIPLPPYWPVTQYYFTKTRGKANDMTVKEKGSIISVVGKTTVEIIELFECRQKVP